MGYSDAIDAAAHVALLIDQWAPDTAVYALTREVLGLAQAEMVAPQQRLEMMANTGTAEGVWLDYIGERLGFARPFVDNQTGKFGFRGSDGVGFDQGRFHSANPALGSSDPIGDNFYRRLLQARGRALRSAATPAEIDAIGDDLWSGGAVWTAGATPGDPSLSASVDEDSTSFYELTTGDAAAALLGLPVGVTVTITRA